MEIQAINKIACIGAGHWGSNLIRNFHELNALALICDSDSRRLDGVRFLDPSNMTRGMVLRRKRRLNRMLKSGKLTLRSTLGNTYALDNGRTHERLHEESTLTQLQTIDDPA